MNAAVFVSALTWGGCVALFCHDVATSLLRLRFPAALEVRSDVRRESWSKRVRKAMDGVFRREDVFAQVEEVAIAMAFQLKAGSTVYGALCEAARGGKGTVYSALGRVVQLYGTGLPLLDALDSVLTDPVRPELSHLFSALQVGLMTGGSVPLLLTRTAETCRRRRSFQREVSAKLAESRMTAVILILLPWLVLLLAGGLEPGFFSDLLSHASGKLLMAASLAMWVSGVVFMSLLVGSVVPAKVPVLRRIVTGSPGNRQGKGFSW